MSVYIGIYTDQQANVVFLNLGVMKCEKTYFCLMGELNSLIIYFRILHHNDIVISQVDCNNLR